jgi:hypothetical protein
MEKTINDTYRELFTNWQQSGLSKASFCHREGISKASFYYWSKKFAADFPASNSPIGFSRIEVADPVLPTPLARITYPSGISVELFGSLDPDRIKALLV